MALTSKLFLSGIRSNNPNQLLFEVEKQEGSDILGGDTSTASIGDATMEHIQNMNGLARLAYDHFIKMPDGNLFSVVPSTKWINQDEYNLRGKSDEDMEIIRKKIPVKLHHFYDDEVIREQDRRHNEDLLGHPEAMIPYDQWAEHPGMTKHWDLPPSPRPWTPYAGNCKQLMYDYFPDDHPLASVINRVLTTMDQYQHYFVMTTNQAKEYNRTAKVEIAYSGSGSKYIFTDGSADFLIADLYLKAVNYFVMSTRVDMKVKIHTYHTLMTMIMDIAENKDWNMGPWDHAVKALTELECADFNNYRVSVFKLTKAQDPLFVYLTSCHKKFIQMTKLGKDVYNDIKYVGRIMYTRGFITERDVKQEDGSFLRQVVVQEPKWHHVQKYNRIKEDVLALQAKTKKTQRVSPLVQSFIAEIDKKMEQALAKNEPAIYTALPSVFINAQKNGVAEMGKMEWSQVWAYYNLNKTEVFKAIQPK